MKSKNLEFQISALRQDKLIVGVEAVAINVTCLVISSLFGLVVNLAFIPEMYLFYANMAIFVLGVAYTVYALISNMQRLKKIKALEAEM